MADSTNISTSDDNLCPVCHDTIDIFATGQCNHVTCYRCSVRMRLLCEQMYCPICRTDLRQVFYTTKKTKFELINAQAFCLYSKAMIFSETEAVQKSYFELLKHKCFICEPNVEFNSFQALKGHMTKNHQLMSCKLCCENLKVFSHERKFYTTKDMVHHNRYGDPEDKSYKGHPNCEFCDERYFDKDALYQHLRKDHFYCHFCETDGNTQEFFCKYENLQQHFKKDHYLCEIGECANVQWSNAFRSDIDLKAHVATEHSKGLDKNQTRQLKTLEMNFPSTGERRRNKQRDDRFAQRQRNRHEFEEAQALTFTLAEVQKHGQITVIDRELADLVNAAQNPVQAREPQQKFSDLRESDFPDLNGNLPKPRSATCLHSDDSQMELGKKENHGKSNATSSESMANRLAFNHRFSVKNGKLSEAEFPSLENNSKKSKKATTTTTTLSWDKYIGNPESQKARKPVAQVGQSRLVGFADFPVLGKSKGSQNMSTRADLKQSSSAGNLVAAENATSSSDMQKQKGSMVGTTWCVKKSKTQDDKLNVKKPEEINFVKLTKAEKPRLFKKNDNESLSKSSSFRDQAPKLPTVNSLSDLAKQFGMPSKFEPITESNPVKISDVEFELHDSQSGKKVKKQQNKSLKDAGTNEDENKKTVPSLPATVTFSLGQRDEQDKETHAEQNSDKKKTPYKSSMKSLDAIHKQPLKEIQQQSKTSVEIVTPIDRIEIDPPLTAKKAEDVSPPTPASDAIPTEDFPSLSSLSRAPPGFSRPTNRGPPPGFKVKANPPPGFSNTTTAPNLTDCTYNAHGKRSSKEEDFPALPLNGPPGFMFRRNFTANKDKTSSTSGIWPLPEVLSVEADSAEQKFTRSVLAEKDQSILESLKLILLQLNRGIIDADEFYDSCTRYLGSPSSRLFQTVFSHMHPLVTSAKDKAKLLAKQESHNWDWYSNGDV